ncbi:hypothetical protein J5N97_021212 [Dioscorea zingiberensis]|uniref:Uncharacterized protein n=1 Tax=Dioscorea zingiberensis TaxID=325984 RepID=A0A9D5CIQ2_9LILI|nr:hypothetical protein J5N97_021212 [Dioscorea zingiberensis]
MATRGPKSSCSGPSKNRDETGTQELTDDPSSGDKPGRKTTGTKFEGLGNVSEEQTVEPPLHVSNGRKPKKTFP